MPGKQSYSDELSGRAKWGEALLSILSMGTAFVAVAITSERQRVIEARLQTSSEVLGINSLQATIEVTELPTDL